MQHKRKVADQEKRFRSLDHPGGPESRQQWDGLLSIDSHRTSIAHLIKRADYGVVIVSFEALMLPP